MAEEWQAGIQHNSWDGFALSLVAGRICPFCLRVEAGCAGDMNKHEKMIANGTPGFTFSFYTFKDFAECVDSFEGSIPAPCLITSQKLLLFFLLNTLLKQEETKTFEQMPGTCQTMWIGWTLTFHSFGCLVLTPNERTPKLETLMRNDQLCALIKDLRWTFSCGPELWT